MFKNDQYTQIVQVLKNTEIIELSDIVVDEAIVHGKSICRFYRRKEYICIY